MVQLQWGDVTNPLTNAHLAQLARQTDGAAASIHNARNAALKHRVHCAQKAALARPSRAIQQHVDLGHLAGRCLGATKPPAPHAPTLADVGILKATIFLRRSLRAAAFNVTAGNKAGTAARKAADCRVLKHLYSRLTAGLAARVKGVWTPSKMSKPSHHAGAADQ